MDFASQSLSWHFRFHWLTFFFYATSLDCFCASRITAIHWALWFTATCQHEVHVYPFFKSIYCLLTNNRWYTFYILIWLFCLIRPFNKFTLPWRLRATFISTQWIYTHVQNFLLLLKVSHKLYFLQLKPSQTETYLEKEKLSYSYSCGILPGKTWPRSLSIVRKLTFCSHSVCWEYVANKWEGLIIQTWEDRNKYMGR